MAQQVLFVAPGNLDLDWERTLNNPGGNDVFFELLEPDKLEPGIGLDAAVCSKGCLNQLLLVEPGEEEGHSVYSDDVPYAHFRLKWQGERLRLQRTFTTRSAWTRQVVCLWNPTKAGLPIMEGHHRVHRIAMP